MNGSIAEELNKNTNLFNSLIKRVEVLRKLTHSLLPWNSKIKNCRDIFHFEFTRSLGILNRSYFIPEHQKNTLTFVLHLRMFAGIELIFVYLLLDRSLCFDNSSLCTTM